MIEDVVKRPFITVGMTTFLLLLVLALTSNRARSESVAGGKLHRSRAWRRPAAHCTSGSW